SALAEFDQVFVLGNNQIGTRSRLEPAIVASLAANADVSAGAAIAVRIGLFGRSRFMVKVDGFLIGFESPTKLILKPPVTADRTAMIDQDQIGLALRRSQSAPSHLPVEAKLFGRASQHDAADRRAIEPFYQNHAICD